MAKNSCLLCGVKCLGCAGGHCKCGMKQSQVNIANSVIALRPDYKDVADRVVLGAKMGLGSDDIINAIDNNIELAKPAKVKAMLGYCEYAVGSVREGKRAKCIHCGMERFYGQGKSCESLQDNKK